MTTRVILQGAFLVAVSLFSPLSFANAQEGDTFSNEIVINEFLPAPEGGGTAGEFIELFNGGDTSVNLSGWILDDVEGGGSSPYAITPSSLIEPGQYIAFYTSSPHVSLNDAGDHVRLIQPNGNIVADISYTSSKAGWSYNRVSADTYEESSSPTPNAVNMLSPSPTPMPTPSSTPTPTPSPEAPHYSSNVHISEFLPDPEGSDTSLEFIELHNSKEAVVDLYGWILDDSADSGSSPFIIPEGTTIAAGEYLAFYRTQTKISLNNDSDHVRLLLPNGGIQDDIAYDHTKEGHSHNLGDGGGFHQSSTTTPNALNVITVLPDPTPKPTATPKETQDTELLPTATPIYDFSSRIFINELVPNPKGTDTETEFIELVSLDTRTISLLGWKLDDEVKGSTPYRFPSGTTIAPGEFLVFYRVKTKLALNNDTDMVRLIDPNGKVVSSIMYTPKVPEGQSYSRIPENTFVWTRVLTPGKENSIGVVAAFSKTPKPKTGTSSSRTRAVSSTPAGSTSIVLGVSTTTPLPWPSVLPHRTQVVGGPLPSSSPKKQLFMLFGISLAGVQVWSGVSHREKIWQKR